MRLEAPMRPFQNVSDTQSRIIKGHGHRTILGPTLRQRRFGAEVIYSKDLNKSSIECRMRMLQNSLKNDWKMVEHELKMRERCIITSERRPLRLLRFHQRWVWENGSLNGMQSQRACIFELVSYIIYVSWWTLNLTDPDSFSDHVWVLFALCHSLSAFLPP